MYLQLLMVNVAPSFLMSTIDTSVCVSNFQLCREAKVGEDPKTVGYTTSTGVEGYDFILYVSAHTTQRCSVGTTVAYSAYCQLEGAMDRYKLLVPSVHAYTI